MAEASGVSAAVTFTGLRRDIPDILAAADLYVAPMLQTGFSNAVIEAMATACPVVATDTAGNLETVTHERDALVVTQGNVEALRHAVVRLMDDVGLRQRLGAAARETVLERFTVGRYVAGIQELYEELLEAKSEARAA
jgi:glycosyltransferase involved in cell wall biosynthesis